MANLLARFRRGRTKSLSGTSALTSAGPTLQTTPTPAQITQIPQPAVSAVQSPPLERKIHPDLDSLVANWMPPVPAASASDPAGNSSTRATFSTALRPSTRRHSIDGATPVLRPRHTDTHLDNLPEIPVPDSFTAHPQPPTRTRRLITRLTGSSTPPSSMANTSSHGTGWSTFGRRANVSNSGDNGRPHLTDFGEYGPGSPAPSGISRSPSFSRSQSQSPSQVNLGTPSTLSQQLDDSVTYSNSGHGHQLTPGSELPSPASGFTFGSQGRGSGRASTTASPPPPMPPLDHPAFRGTGKRPHSASQPRQSPVQLPQMPQSRRLLGDPHARSSSSLPSMHSSSRRKRFGSSGDRTKVHDIFSSLSRPGSARRRASAEFNSSQAATALGASWEANVSREVVFLALGAGGGSEQEGKSLSAPTYAKDVGPDDGDLRDVKFDARAKRVGGSSDTQLGDPFVWADHIPVHSTESSASTMEQKNAGTTLLLPPSLSFTAATPEGSPAAPRVRSASEGVSAVLRPPTPTRSNSDGVKKGKRKAEDAEGTPPKDAKATVTLDPRPLHASQSTNSSRVPSSYTRQKRAKLTMAPDQPPSRPSSRAENATAANAGSASSRGSAAHQHSRAPSRASSMPISALVAPHAPSVARSAGGTAYHMRDPRKPPRVQPTGWGLELGEGIGSPVHAWLFFIGFVLFPLWWVAGFCVPVPRTRQLGGDVEEKGRVAPVVLDDPQVEFDARSWRRRCRIMAGISLVIYVPFIVLLAVFLSRARRT